MRLALVGAGERGMVYSRYAHEILGAHITAVADLDRGKRERARELFGIPAEMVFEDAMDLINAVTDVDALIIATLDRAHYAQAMAGLERGFHLLLEKPISPDPLECLNICRKAQEKQRSVTVCHVLRYSPFFVRLREILASQSLGRIIAIEHTENIGNYHMAHSFVRGNWRNSGLSSPIIMQKSCHDMDILLWLTGKHARRISSAGSLRYFVPGNAPAGSTGRCLDCPVSDGCRFDARKVYLPIAGSWPATALTRDQSREGIMKALREGPYGRCVFRCDNNVCDHQSTLIEFEDGVTACFTLSGMTNNIRRTLHIMCEDGEIWGDDSKGEIRISRFRSSVTEEYREETIYIGDVSGSHNGGDEGLMRDFAAGIQGERSTDSRTSVQKSVESHLMACAAEEARLHGCTIDLAAYTEELEKQLDRPQYQPC